jgi:hypothetical protein
MANALYELGREGFLAGEIDWNTAVIKANLYSGYTPNLNTHKFISDVTGAGGTARGTAQTLTSPTVTLGVADAADITFTAVAAGAAIPYVVIYQASAVGGGADVGPTLQRLIALIDTTTGVTLPITPNGGDIIISWDNGANKIFKL